MPRHQDFLRQVVAAIEILTLLIWISPSAPIPVGPPQKKPGQTARHSETDHGRSDRFNIDVTEASRGAIGS